MVVPFFLSGVLIMVSALPLHLPSYDEIAVDIGLIAVFYWAIYRPDLFPSMAAFILGLWQDILLGTPMGLHGLIFLLANAVIGSQRTFFQGKSFNVVWWSFSLVAFAASFLAWVVVCAINVTLISPVSIFFHTFLTIGVFPFAAWFFAKVQHAILRPIDV